MKILFCKTSAMKYYKGANEYDIPYNGGKYIEENGYGNEQYNFTATRLNDGKKYCLGFTETKATINKKRNELHIEKIKGCELMKKDNSVDNVLVIWCATTDLNETSIIGWYKNATVYRNYQYFKTSERGNQEYNVLAKKENCILLPKEERHRYIWNAPVAKKQGFGFGQSMVWYGNEGEANNRIEEIIQQICEYNGDNWIDKNYNN